MKLSQLLKPYKPKTPKKQPDPWFFGWTGGYIPPEGGVTEELEYRKVHTKEDLPKRIHVAKSFIMVLHEGSPVTSYIVKQMLGDTLGVVFLHRAFDGGQWVFAPSTTLFKAGTYDKDDMMVFTSAGQMYNALKLKWWVENRLIQLGVLPPKVGAKDAN